MSRKEPREDPVTVHVPENQRVCLLLDLQST